MKYYKISDSSLVDFYCTNEDCIYCVYNSNEMYCKDKALKDVHEIFAHLEIKEGKQND